MKLETAEMRKPWEQDYSLYLIESTSKNLEGIAAELVIRSMTPEYRRSGTKIKYELKIEDNLISINLLGKEEQPEKKFDITGIPQSTIYIRISEKESVQNVESEKWAMILDIIAGKSYLINFEYNNQRDKFLLTA